jgi:hypothetical protein
MPEHLQIKVAHPDGDEIEVDEKIAPFLKLLWEHDIDTELSCQDNPVRGNDRVWINFRKAKDATKFVELAVSRPDPEFELDSLYNRAYIHYMSEKWLWCKLEDIKQSKITHKLWDWSCGLADFGFDSWGEEFVGPSEPVISVSVRFPFSDIEQLTKNILNQRITVQT